MLIYQLIFLDFLKNINFFSNNHLLAEQDQAWILNERTLNNENDIGSHKCSFRVIFFC